MLDARVLELINGEIDGELEPEERAELDAVLASSAEAKTMRAEMLKLTNLLDGMPEQTPPAGLTNQILEQVRLPANRWPFSLGGLLGGFNPARLGLAFATGLLVTVAFYEMSSGQRLAVDVSSMVGTMVMDPQSVSEEQVSHLSISGQGVFGSVVASDVGDILVLSFDLNAQEQTEIVIAMANAGLDFGGISSGASSGVEASELYQVSGGSLRVLSETSRPFNVYLRRVDEGKDHRQGVGIKVNQQGERVFEGSLQLGGESR